MSIDHDRLVYLRGESDAERLSWGEVIEIQEAFEEIPDAELPEPRENALISDMLGELEARDPDWKDPGLFHREDQEAETLYLTLDGGYFWTPDGEGRIFYDSLDEALADLGLDPGDVVELDKPIAPW